MSENVRKRGKVTGSLKKNRDLLLKKKKQHRHTQPGWEVARWATVICATILLLMALVVQVALTACTCEVHLWNSNSLDPQITQKCIILL